jgi:DNA-binding transcriptional regulator YdaS (Cro superfamily)
MTLSSYLANQNMTRAQFAARLGVHPVTVSKWCSGAMRPAWSAIERIQAETGGQVTAQDFIKRQAEIAA